MRIKERPWVGLFNLGNDLGQVSGTEEGRAFGTFDFTHFFSHFGALSEQAQELLIERVNLNAQFA